MFACASILSAVLETRLSSGLHICHSQNVGDSNLYFHGVFGGAQRLVATRLVTIAELFRINVILGTVFAASSV